jgi:WD40 repeat protein
VGIFSVRTLEREQSFSIGGDGGVTALAWAAGDQLVVGGRGGVAQVWSVAGEPRRVRELSGVQGDVTSLALSPDGRTVAATSFVPPPEGDFRTPETGWVGSWDLASGRPGFAHDLGAPGLSIAFAPDGRRLAVGTADAKALLLDRTGRTTRTLDLTDIASGSVTAVTFRADGTLLTGTWSGIVQHWDPATGKQLGRAVLVEAAPVSGLAMSPTSERFAVSGGSSGGVRIWDDTSLQQYGADFPGGAGAWGTVTYTPDGSSVVVAYGGGTAGVWPVSVDAWLDHACTIAGRNFSQEEWRRFVPDHDYERTCPQFPAGA